MEGSKSSAFQWLVVAIIAVSVPATGFYFAYRLFFDGGSPIEQAAWLVPLHFRTSLPLPEHSSSGALTLYRFDSEISQSEVYDIQVDGQRLWLGTGKGLLAWEPGVGVVRYQQFANAPFEWVQDLDLDAGMLATDIHVSARTTGGKYTGTHIFDTLNETWQPIGESVLDQVWLDGVLWQRPVKEHVLLRTWETEGQWQSEVVPLHAELCSGAAMAAIEHVLWIAQQGMVRSGSGSGGGNVRAMPCGVIRYDPVTNSEDYYDEGRGMNSGFGRDVAGDDRQVWVSHSIKHDRMSFLDNNTDRWQSARPYGSGNVIALSDRAVWLGTPSSSDPFVRIDRRSQKRTNISGVPAEFYVSAIAIDGDVIWLGLYRQNWQGSTYTIDSFLAKYVDPWR